MASSLSLLGHQDIVIANGRNVRCICFVAKKDGAPIRHMATGFVAIAWSFCLVVSLILHFVAKKERASIRHIATGWVVLVLLLWLIHAPCYFGWYIHLVATGKTSTPPLTSFRHIGTGSVAIVLSIGLVVPFLLLRVWERPDKANSNCCYRTDLSMFGCPLDFGAHL